MKPVSILFRLAAAWAFAHALWAVSSGFRDRPGPARAALVLGNKVEESGVPSERLMRRLQAAYELYRQGLAQVLVVSGGTGREGYDEAAVMRNTLITFGVRENAIIADSAGVDTMATARNYARIASEQKLEMPIIVSDYFHIERVRLALSMCGVETKFSSHAAFDFHLKEIWYVPREVIGYYGYWLFYRC